MSTITPSCIAIIPARGGSKGVPRKNVRLLAGKPLVAWTIEAALGAEQITTVYVSTDDAEIAQVAREYGARVIDRPASLSGDTVSSESALLHALDTVEATGGTLPELTVFLQCTSPLTTSDDIDGTVERLFAESADTALTVTPAHSFLWRMTENGADGINHDKQIRLRRQDMEPQYRETGAVYVMKTAQFRERGHRFFGRIALYPTKHGIDIDTLLDFNIAEQMLKR